MDAAVKLHQKNSCAKLTTKNEPHKLLTSTTILLDNLGVVNYANYSTLIINQPGYKKVLRFIEKNQDAYIKAIRDYSKFKGHDDHIIRKALFLLDSATVCKATRKLVQEFAQAKHISSITREECIRLLSKYADEDSLITLTEIALSNSVTNNEASLALYYHLEHPIPRKFFFRLLENPKLFNEFVDEIKLINRFKGLEIRTNSELELVNRVLNDGSNSESARYAAWVCLQGNKKIDASAMNSAEFFHVVLKNADTDYAFHTFNCAGLEPKNIKSLAAICQNNNCSTDNERIVSLIILAKATNNNPIDEISKYSRKSRKAIINNIAKLISGYPAICKYFKREDLLELCKISVSSKHAIKYIKDITNAEWKSLLKFALKNGNKEIQTSFLGVLLKESHRTEIPKSLVRRFNFSKNELGKQIQSGLLHLEDPNIKIKFMTENLYENQHTLTLLASQGSLEACYACVNCLYNGDENEKYALLATMELSFDTIHIRNFAKTLKKLSLIPTLSKEESSNFVKYSQSIELGLEIGINHPFRYLPDTLCRLVKNRTKPDRTNQPTTIFLTSGAKDATMVITDEYMQKITFHHRVILFEVSNKNGFFSILEQISGSKFSQADNLILSFHGGIGFITFDNTKYIERPEEVFLTIKDLQSLSQNATSILKPRAHILSLACYGGNSHGINQHLERVFKRRTIGSETTGITLNIRRQPNSNLLSPVFM